jgi:hypothetical protein
MPGFDFVERLQGHGRVFTGPTTVKITVADTMLGCFDILIL